MTSPDETPRRDGWRRRWPLLLSAMAVAGLLAWAVRPRENGCGEKNDPADANLRRACAWLWQQQARDGGWHSGTYALLRPGRALTPFILDALMNAPAGVFPPPPGGVERALEFIRNHTGPDGVLGAAVAGVFEYPNYATAYADRKSTRLNSSH